MTMVVTVAERKRNEAERRYRAATQVADDLRAYAASKGGRFILFGSFASRSMRYDSDLDVLVDFHPSEVEAALSFVEAACALASIDLDIHDAAASKAAFVRRAIETGVAVP